MKGITAVHLCVFGLVSIASPVSTLQLRHGALYPAHPSCFRPSTARYFTTHRHVSQYVEARHSLPFTFYSIFRSKPPTQHVAFKVGMREKSCTSTNTCGLLKSILRDMIQIIIASAAWVIPSKVLAVPNLSAAGATMDCGAKTMPHPLLWFGAVSDGIQNSFLPEFTREFTRFAGEVRDALPPVEASPRLLGQLVIALAAYRISTIVAWGVRGYCVDNHIDVTTAIFLAELLRYGTLLLASIVLFQAFGIQTPQSFTAIVTSLTLAVGLSFQSVLSNFAAGVMLLVFRPYSVGDKVKIGNRIGFVYDISLLATRVDTEDNIRIQVPNSQILNGVVENYTLNPLRRVEVLVTVSSKADIRKTREVIQAAISPFAYLAIAGSTGPAKGAQPAAAKGAQPPSASAQAQPHADAVHAPHDDAAPQQSSSARSSWGGKALSNLFRQRKGELFMSPSDLMAGLAQQYTQLWKLANGQFRFELADVATKKAPKPEVARAREEEGPKPGPPEREKRRARSPGRPSARRGGPEARAARAREEEGPKPGPPERAESPAAFRLDP